MVVAVPLGPAEKVGELVVYAGAVLGPDGQVVAQRDAVQLAQQAGERLAARGLPVDDVHVRAVVHVEQQRLAAQQRAVGRSAGYYGQELAPRDLSVRVVEVGVFRGV